MVDSSLRTAILTSHPDYRSKGYASFDYEDAGYAASDLVKVRGVVSARSSCPVPTLVTQLNLMLNSKPIDALASE